MKSIVAVTGKKSSTVQNKNLGQMLLCFSGLNLHSPFLCSVNRLYGHHLFYLLFCKKKRFLFHINLLSLSPLSQPHQKTVQRQLKITQTAGKVVIARTYATINHTSRFIKPSLQTHTHPGLLNWLCSVLWHSATTVVPSTCICCLPKHTLRTFSSPYSVKHTPLRPIGGGIVAIQWIYNNVIRH